MSSLRIVSSRCPFRTVSPRRAYMPVIFPDTNETTGTARETSGATVPVTVNSEVAVCAVAATSGNWWGWSVVNRLGSPIGVILAAGGASFVSSPCALLQPLRSSIEERNASRRRTFRALPCMTDSNSRGCEQDASNHANALRLELHHDSSADGRLTATEIREPDTAGPTAIRVSSRQIVCAGRCAAHAGGLCRSAVVAAGRRNSAAARPIWNIGVALTRLDQPGNVLLL